MDVEDLIDTLCTTADMIMEDASTGAIFRDTCASERVKLIAEAADDIAALARAAFRLSRYSTRT